MPVCVRNRIFIRNDAFISRWLFGSTRALKWGSFNFPRLSDAPKEANRFAVIIGACINVVPVFRPKIVVGILKVALLVTSTQLLTRLPRDHARNFIYAVFATAACGSIIFLGIIAEFGGTKTIQKHTFTSHRFLGFHFVMGIGSVDSATVVTVDI